MYNCVRFDGLDIQNGIIVKRLVSPPSTGVDPVLSGVRVARFFSSV